MNQSIHSVRSFPIAILSLCITNLISDPNLSAGELAANGSTSTNGNASSNASTKSNGKNGTKKKAEAEVGVHPISGPSGSSHDGVNLGAPGVGNRFRTVGELPFTEMATIGRFYRYTFTGIEVQADADGVLGSYPYDGFMWSQPKPKSNNGHGNNCDGVDSSNPGKSKKGLDSDPTVDDECKGSKNGKSNGSGQPGGGTPVHVLGWWRMRGKVNDVSCRNLTFTTPELHAVSAVLRIYLERPVEFEEETIRLQWSGEGNSQDPDGHFYLLGSAIKEPPIPTGTLNVKQKVYQGGTRPRFEWEIRR